MTRIDFYFNAPDKLGVAATLARKAYVKKNRLLVYTRDAVQLDAFDKLLWTVPPTGFLPHCRLGSKLAGATPIVLSGDARMDAGSMPHHGCRPGDDFFWRKPCAPMWQPRQACRAR